MKHIELLIQAVSDALFGAYGEHPVANVKVGIPPDVSLGDFAIECFVFAKQFKKAPDAIARDLAAELADDAYASYEAAGPYLNVRIKNEELFKAAYADMTPHTTKGKTVMVEYLSPNTNKPLHLGHVRNGVLGMAVSNILERAGHTVIKANLVNDRGVHICKSMLAWQLWGNGQTPESSGMKGDHFVGMWYVRFAQETHFDAALAKEAQAKYDEWEKGKPCSEQEMEQYVRIVKETQKKIRIADGAQELLKKWEDGDQDTLALWETMNKWVYAGFDETYKKLGFVFDTFYHESELYTLGKDIIQKGLEDGTFVRLEDGAIGYVLPATTFGKARYGDAKTKILLRGDGTSVYMTQDIGVAVKKAEDYKLDASVYVVANEQDEHFKILFDIMRALGYPWATQCYHLSYGMVDLPNGRMKSREGTVVDADDLIAEVVSLAAKEVMSKNPELSDEEVQQRATAIGIGAIKFYMIRSSPKQKIKFNPEESVSFEGVTAPYVQYAYARAKSIVEKAAATGLSKENADLSMLGNNEDERLVANKLLALQESVIKAAELYNPALVATAVYELAKAFHQFYKKQPVIVDDAKLAKARLSLVSATASAIKTGLGLLGIDVLEKM